MKIGTSLIFCIQDILAGLVKLDDVLYILVNSDIKDADALLDLVDKRIDDWGVYCNFSNLDKVKNKKIALNLYTSQKIYQQCYHEVSPYPPMLNYRWIDVYPTVTEENTAVKEAWERYRMTVTLVNGTLQPLTDYFGPP